MKTAFNRRTVILAAALGAGTTLLQACGGGDDEPQRNIVELAKNTPELSILVEAVVAADLAATLSTGTLTVPLGATSGCGHSCWHPSTPHHCGAEFSSSPRTRSVTVAGSDRRPSGVVPSLTA